LPDGARRARLARKRRGIRRWSRCRLGIGATGRSAGAGACSDGRGGAGTASGRTRSGASARGSTGGSTSGRARGPAAGGTGSRTRTEMTEASLATPECAP